MYIWLKVSDSLNGLTAVHGGESLDDFDKELDPSSPAGVIAKTLLLHDIGNDDDYEYSHEPPIAVVEALTDFGWRRAREHDKDNGYVYGTCFARP